MALLELSQAGANLVEFTHFLTEQLGQDQDLWCISSAIALDSIAEHCWFVTREEALDLIEEKVAAARESTRQAVSGLQMCPGTHYFLKLS